MALGNMLIEGCSILFSSLPQAHIEVANCLTDKGGVISAT